MYRWTCQWFLNFILKTTESFNKSPFCKRPGRSSGSHLLIIFLLAYLKLVVWHFKMCLCTINFFGGNFHNRWAFVSIVDNAIYLDKVKSSFRLFWAKVLGARMRTWLVSRMYYVTRSNNLSKYACSFAPLWSVIEFYARIVSDMQYSDCHEWMPISRFRSLLGTRRMRKPKCEKLKKLITSSFQFRIPLTGI